MELRDYIDVLRRQWLSIVVITLATLALAAGVTLYLTPQYTATTRLFFGVQGGDSGSDLAQGNTFTEQQMASYAQVATSPLVLSQVIAELKLPTTADLLAQKVVARAPTDTVILEISAQDVDAQQSARIANAIGDHLAATAVRLSPARRDGSQAVRATILARAQSPDSPSSPKIVRNLAVGMALGLLLGLGVALLRRILDTNVHSEADVAAVTASAVLGVVPFDPGAPSHPVVMRDDPLSARSEAIRRLRTNLQFVDVAEHARSIVISSSIAGEGKSTTAINLAVSLADAGLKVLLIDADLRRPSIADYLGLEGQVGLTTVLIGSANVDEVTQRWQQSSLDVLPAGQVPPNPSELLGSKAMTSLLHKLSDRYDMVLLDSSPLLPVTDAAILSQAAGGTLVVVGADHIHRAQLRHAIESLSTVGANVLGLVLNKVSKRDVAAYRYDGSYPSNPSDPPSKDAGHHEDTAPIRHDEVRQPAAALVSRVQGA